MQRHICDLYNFLTSPSPLSGTNVDLASKTERGFFDSTMALFTRHGIKAYAKDTSHQLTHERTNDQEITVCMNQRVVDEASAIISLPEGTLNWDIVDIGEGHRTVAADKRRYEEEIFQEVARKVDELVDSSIRTI